MARYLTHASRASGGRLLAVGAISLLFMALIAKDTKAVVAPADFFGVSAAGQLGGEVEREEIDRLGPNRVRNNFVWWNTQTSKCDGFSEPSGYDFTSTDYIVRRAAFNGIRIVGDIYGTRVGKKEKECDVHPFPIPGTQLYEDFTKKTTGYVWQLVRRYGANGVFWQQNPETPYLPVEVWEVWNEPNLPLNNPGYELSKLNAQRYAKLLIDTSRTIREAQEAQSGQPVEATGTKVLMGGLVTVASAKNFKEYFDWIFQEPTLYTASEFKSSFDGLGFHPYAIGGTPKDVQEHVNNARTVLTNQVGSEKTIWITEFGWPVGTFGSATVDETKQDEYIGEMLNWLYKNADEKKIKYAVVYVYQDHNPGCTDWSCWAGLKDISGKDRPSWCTVQVAITGACVGRHPKWPGDNLQGNITGDPAISSAGTNKLELFARGADGALWHRNWNGITWSSWGSLGGALASGSGPGTVSWNDSRVDVVFRGTDNGVWQRAWGEGSNGGVPVSLGGYTLSDPAISSKGKGQLQVFLRGADNALWTKSFSSGSWSSWETLGGQITSGPGAVSWGSGRTDVVARGTDNGVWHWYWENGSWHLESIGGSVASDPTISTLGPNTLDVFARGWDNHLWHQSFHEGKWWGWESLGTIVTSGPGAVSWGSQRTDVVARTDDWSVQHSWWSP